MKYQIIDLSLPIDDTLKETHAAKIERIGHKDGVEHLNWVLMNRTPEGKARFEKGERLIKPEEVPDQELLSLEIVNSSVHMGTHVDAPFHYGSHCEGKPARTIEDLPLEWCIGDGVVLNVRHVKYPASVTKIDIINALINIKYVLKPLDIVLLNTGADKKIGTPEYVTEYLGIETEAIEYLLDQKIKMIGVDTLGLDRPCPDMFKDFLATKDKTKLWPSHFLGRRREFSHMERLANLDKIPRSSGFTVSCLPVKVKNAGAGWARVVAIVK